MSRLATMERGAREVAHAPWWIACLAVFLAACASDVADPLPRVAPTIGATAVAMKG